MRQQINLLQYDLKERKAVLPAIQVLVALALAVLIAIVGSGWAQLKADKASETTRTLEAELALKQESLLSLTQSRVAIEVDPRLEVRLTQLELELDQLRLISRLVGSHGNERKLSGFIAGLGRQRPEGLWLSFIHIGQSGANIILEGHTLDAAYLPDYIAGLGVEQAYEGLRFGELSLERADATARWLDFRVVAGCRDMGCPGSDGDSR